MVGRIQARPLHQVSGDDYMGLTQVFGADQSVLDWVRDYGELPQTVAWDDGRRKNHRGTGYDMHHSGAVWGEMQQSGSLVHGQNGLPVA